MGIETALLGSAFFGPAMAGGAAMGGTAGLFGTAGAFSLGTTLGTLGTALGIGSAASSIFGGMDASAAADQQAEAAKASAEMAGKESARQSVARAQEIKSQSDDIRRRQKLAYMKSGVSLEGSPLLVMEQTRRQGQQNIDEILASGASGYVSSVSEGRTRANALKQTGRQAFWGGLSSGGSSLLKAFS